MKKVVFTRMTAVAVLGFDGGMPTLTAARAQGVCDFLGPYRPFPPTSSRTLFEIGPEIMTKDKFSCQNRRVYCLEKS